MLLQEANTANITLRGLNIFFDKATEGETTLTRSSQMSATVKLPFFWPCAYRELSMTPYICAMRIGKLWLRRLSCGLRRLHLFRCTKGPKDEPAMGELPHADLAWSLSASWFAQHTGISRFRPRNPGACLYATCTLSPPPTRIAAFVSQRDTTPDLT